MKTIMKITKSIVSLFIVTLISFGICAIVALSAVYIFGLNDTTIRFGVLMLFFGTILIALILGAFD